MTWKINKMIEVIYLLKKDAELILQKIKLCFCLLESVVYAASLFQSMC